MRNIALVGAGRWGKNLARNFDELGALHTICDSSQPLLNQFQEKYSHVRLSDNFRSVLENPSITRVAIAAPAAVHYELAREALLAGKDVYVEKPLCLNSADGEKLVALAEREKRILMTGHLLQYHPYILHLQELVQKGELGDLQYITSNRLDLGAIRLEENALWNFAPHDISVILSLCGHSLPWQVRCMGAAYVSEGVVDKTLTSLRFEGNLRAHIYVSWLNPFKEQKLVVVGSAGMAVFDDTKPWQDKLLFYRNPVHRTQDAVPFIGNTVPEKLIVEQKEPLKEECRHFIHCCDHRITPKTDGNEGLRVLKVLQAAQDSLNADAEARNPNQ